MSGVVMLIRRLQRVVGSEGLKGLVGLVRANIRSEFVYWRFVCELAGCRHHISMAGQRWTDIVLERGNLQRLAQWRSLRPARSLPAWLWMDVERGLDFFYVAWCGGELVHICWVVRPGQATSVPGWQLAAGEVELRSAYTMPKFRGRGIWRLMLAFIIEDVRVVGDRSLYAHVAPHNRRSWGPLLQAGFRRVATVRVRKRWGRVYVVEEYQQGEIEGGMVSA